MKTSPNNRAIRSRQTGSSAETTDTASDITIRNPTILVVGDEDRSLVGNLLDTAFERFAVIAASPRTGWELFQHGMIALVLFKHHDLDDLRFGRAMKEYKPSVPIIVLADNWTELEGLNFADVLLSACVDPQVLSRHVQAQLEATRGRAA